MKIAKCELVGQKINEKNVLMNLKGTTHNKKQTKFISQRYFRLEH